MLCTYWEKQTRRRSSELASAKNNESASFRYLLATMPAVFGRPGPDDDDDAGEHGS